MSQRSSGSQRAPVTEDERLLTSAPQAERRGFTRTDPWRVLRILGEFVEGFDTLADVHNAVTIFGSARTPADDPFYERAVVTARLLAREGFAGARRGTGSRSAATSSCRSSRGSTPTLSARSTFAISSCARRCS